MPKSKYTQFDVTPLERELHRKVDRGGLGFAGIKRHPTAVKVRRLGAVIRVSCAVNFPTFVTVMADAESQLIKCTAHWGGRSVLFVLEPAWVIGIWMRPVFKIAVFVFNDLGVSVKHRIEGVDEYPTFSVPILHNFVGAPFARH